MAVYFQFKSSLVKESMPIDGPFISVGELKGKISETKLVLRGRKTSDSTIIISNYETREDYLSDSALISEFATVWARRLPVQASMPIIVNPPPVSAEPEEPEEIDPEDREWAELLDVINGKSETLASQSGNAPAPEIDDEDSRIKALVETSALQGGGFGWNTPPPGYICHRCSVPGHLIKYCPTNGDPAYDIKKIRPPTGIPKSMLVATPDGSYALPTGGFADLRPNEAAEAAFDKEMEGISSSSRSAAQFPPELYCRLCKQVMDYAMLTSRCCYDSFCDRCIRGHIISKRSCVCGATDVLADDLIPNVTLREAISHILESNSGSSSSGEGASQVQDPPSTQQSAASKQVLPPPEKQEPARSPKAEVESQASAPVADEEVEQKPEAPKEMKTGMTMPMPVAANNYMMPPVAYNPYWGGMNAFMASYVGYGYGYGPMNMPLGGESREANTKRKRDEDQEHGRKVRSRRSSCYKPSPPAPRLMCVV